MAKHAAHPPKCESDPNSGYDPLQNARREAPTLNSLWLKNGEKQTLNQKIGFTIFSLVSVASGLYMAADALIEFREADWFGALCSGAVAAFFLFFGVLGLRNVMRFSRDTR